MHAMGEGDMVLYFKQAKAEFVPSLSLVEVEDEVGVQVEAGVKVEVVVEVGVD